MEIYTARAGDTTGSLARRFGIGEPALIYANQLGDPRRLTAGLALAIPKSEDSPTDLLETGACVSPAMPDSVLQELLPSLSFLCPFCRGVGEDGGLTEREEGRLLEQARRAGCPALLAAANIDGDGAYSSAAAHKLLASSEAQENFIRSALIAIERDGYRGLYLSLLYLYPFDREPYNSFLQRLSHELHHRGYYLVTALAPKEEESAESLLCSAHDYSVHGALADRVALLAYDWGYSGSAPQAVSPVNRIRRVLSYASGRIPAGKILLGLSSYGYNWNLPWRQGDAASPIGHASAVNLAVSTGAEIKYDRAFQASYFTYSDSGDQRHIVWFEDLRSVQARLELVEEYGLAGVCLWSPNRVYRPALRLIQSRYSADRLT